MVSNFSKKTTKCKRGPRRRPQNELNLLDWIQDKQEVEIVDLILRIREKLTFATNNNLVVNTENVNKLQKHLQGIISSLPEDLQSVLKS